MLVYPAIDIFNGKCVRLKRGDFDAQSIYSAVPADQARMFLDSGLNFLHVVDLNGAKEGRIINRDALSAILRLPGVHTQIGGGIRSHQDITSLLNTGADRVVVGSLALQSPHIVHGWIREFSSDRIVIAVDVRKGAIAYKGWLEHANLSPATFIERMTQAGAVNFLCTDIDRDGMLGGPNLELYASLQAEFPALHFIASGGVSRLKDIDELKATGCSGVVVGKALYEGQITTQQLASYAAT